MTVVRLETTKGNLSAKDKHQNGLQILEILEKVFSKGKNSIEERKLEDEFYRSSSFSTFCLSVSPFDRRARVSHVHKGRQTDITHSIG